LSVRTMSTRPRWEKGSARHRLRGDDQWRGMSGGRGGVSGKHGRPHDGSGSNREAARTVWIVPGGDGGRSRNVDATADRQAQAASRLWMDHRTEEHSDSRIGGAGGFAEIGRAHV